ncbi:hypothetical protein DITRI_Ditri04bG0015900 [Diplodiscus trichospermus]
MPRDFKSLFIAWNDVLTMKSCDKVWKLALFAIIWTVWMTRNDLVFNNRQADLEQTIDLSKLRLAHWLDSNTCKEEQHKKCHQLELPDKGVLKFNADGSIIGNLRPAGIGRSVYIVLSSPWANDHAIIIESDCANAVKWVSNPQVVPWLLRKWIAQIENLKTQIKDWKVIHVLRECNGIADSLAKAGASGSGNFVDVAEV